MAYDRMTPEARSALMSRIRGKDTKPELFVRRALHAIGLRFRLHRQDLPGRPDLAFPKYRAVVFVNGCFWHGHHCALSKIPASNSEFWRRKIELNRVRDGRARSSLGAMGWRVLTVWECAVRGRGRRDSEDIAYECAEWLRGCDAVHDIGSGHEIQGVHRSAG